MIVGTWSRLKMKVVFLSLLSIIAARCHLSSDPEDGDVEVGAESAVKRFRWADEANEGRSLLVLRYYPFAPHGSFNRTRL
jgi:hypothetical protein